MPQADPVKLLLGKLCVLDDEFPFRSPPNAVRCEPIIPDENERIGLELLERYERARRRTNFDETIVLHTDMWRRGHVRATDSVQKRKEEEVKWVRVHRKQEKTLRDFNRTCDNLYRLTRDLGLGIIGCEGLLANPAGSIYERMSPNKQAQMKDRIIAEGLRLPSTVYDGQFEEYVGVQLGGNFSYEDFYYQNIRGQPEGNPNQPPAEDQPEVEPDICTICREPMAAESDDVTTLPCSHRFHILCWAQWRGGNCCICRRVPDQAYLASRAGWVQEVQNEYMGNIINMMDFEDNAHADDISNHHRDNGQRHRGVEEHESGAGPPTSRTPNGAACKSAVDDNVKVLQEGERPAEFWVMGGDGYSVVRLRFV